MDDARTLVLAATAVVVVASAAALPAAVDRDDPAAPAPVDEDHADHDHRHDQDETDGGSASAGSAAPSRDCGDYTGCFDEGQGQVPTEEEAEDLEQVRSIRIEGDDGFTPAAGVRSGNGTRANPYVISGYHVSGDLYLQDTDACVVVEENWIDGQLSLNWNGPCVHVHHNHVDDLRVNENINRSGYATGGIIERNEIELIGQLRHFDGEFRHNTVGPEQADSLWDEVRETAPFPWHRDPRVANVDGFNQGWLHNNTFQGSVDLDFHGHHHGTGFFAPLSHYHGGDADRHMHVDHSERWTSVRFTDNLIEDPYGYGLRYEDQAHSADDETAASEDIDDLDDDHRHHTRIEIGGNTVRKAGIWVDIFHAEDDDHEQRNEGWLYLTDNTVRLNERDDEGDGPLGVPIGYDGYQLHSAIRLWTAKEVEAVVAGNDLEFVADDDEGLLHQAWPDRDPKAKAIDLDRMRTANVTVRDNTARGFHYGVYAQELTNTTHWSVLDNDFGDVEYDVWYDDSVDNEPRRS